MSFLMNTILEYSYDQDFMVDISLSDSKDSKDLTKIYKDYPEKYLINQNEKGNEIKKEHTIIIFDWDDTLMCSSFFVNLNISIQSDPTDIHQHWISLDKLSKSVIEVIESSQEYGEVVIVTNAEEGWVQLSAQKFMPELIPILSGIKIYSARSTFEKLYPENYYMWKYMAMKDLIYKKDYPYNSKKNIISFGDSIAERLSAINVSKFFFNSISKTVKFSEKSSIEELIKQIDLLRLSLKYIVDFDEILDLQLTLTSRIGV